jgi:nucleotide-binding universal stress UspA family protein
MSKIIAAVDFSECSINAFMHALSIAGRCKRDLELVWVQKPAGEKDKFVEQVNNPADKVRQQFEEMIAKYQPELPHNKISYKIRTGKVYKEIAAEANSTKAMLVVAGTHGSSGFEEFWIGSNATKIISICSCPVITIRAGINITVPLTTIVMPIDSSPETRQKSSFTGYLAKEHNAEVIILSLYTTKVRTIQQNVDLFAKQVGLYFEETGVRYRIDSVEANNISDASIDYSIKAGANLISIMTQQESSTSTLWMGPYAHQTVNHSPIPVLSIHPKNTLAAGSGF